MLNEYINYLKSSTKEYSKCTLKAYEPNVSKFLQWLKERYNENDSYAITTLDIREYQGYLINIKKYAPAGVQQRIMSMLSYCRFLYDKKYLKIDVTANFKLIQVQSKDTAPSAPSTNEINRFKREIYKKNNLRDIAIIEMFLNTGIRASELINLDIQDISISKRKGVVHVRQGKRKKFRDIPLNQDVRESLNAYIKEVNPQNKLWIGQRGVLTQDGINKMIKRYAKKVNLETKIYPHAFRHYFATRLLRHKKIDIAIVSKLLGHFNLNTTQIYVKPTFEDLSDALDNLNI
ncbi:tyrosine-type recombinase/integrase [Clostridium sp. CM028]|uniref:tyrosine-type recombinase/integrase n=1 Tax=unclassified Clostridium TaxID=2614128 RepID=UPI001C6ED90C|nr:MULTISPECIES: tyrosine-type recombinase/integrase [unclassified Clostridium]MBW9147210.1 tyrosine-type recombinase/integrase [Clostridium sp. CM027]MBW9150435.1 tyrosine-type recombinase/integrase [Clostridium sp. CM028]UVE42821.1 tyrosine-type recombinase/integrase [Clostridium sp. CM027]WLC63490.1 tyrosine-type recombinase/integrase [Clostridium sp. CM028]